VFQLKRFIVPDRKDLMVQLTGLCNCIFRSSGTTAHF